jgi:arginyl-tRNA synthetase
VPDLEALLTARLAPAFAQVSGTAADPAVRRSHHSDFQADGALALARIGHRPPARIAAEVLAAADLTGLATAQVAGPGYLNLTVSTVALAELLGQIAADPRLGVPPASQPEVVAVDYSAPNAAKEMHVGHLRSTILGDAAVRLLQWQGHTVIRQNHIGDWGTPFGMLIEHLRDTGAVGDLTEFYQASRRAFGSTGSEQAARRARQRVVALQAGDPESVRLWDRLVTESKRFFAVVYDRLGVRLTEDDYDAESSYHDQIPSMMAELEARGRLRGSDGARCVFPAGFVNRQGAPLPLIVQKSDGGFGYVATDLATIRHRISALKATRLLYVVGLPQSQYLQMVFQVAREAGWLAPPVRAEHVGHGAILGPDGTMLRSRAGTVVKLIDLLDGAVERAARLSPDPAVARAVGIGAVKYADLSTQRGKDYVFSLDRMLSLDGNTAPYLQYARARICSILRRGGITTVSPAPLLIAEPAEHTLAVELLGFEPVIVEVAESLEFHVLARYLYRLASAFTAFFEHCPVLSAAGPVRDSRLVLCDLTSRTLWLGLDLLGIESPDRM